MGVLTGCLLLGSTEAYADPVDLLQGIAAAETGEIVTFGMYEEANNTSNGKEALGIRMDDTGAGWWWLRHPALITISPSRWTEPDT